MLTMQFREIFVVYSENHTKQINRVIITQCFILKLAVPVVTTVLQMVNASCFRILQTSTTTHM
jgi:hypothetical protein